MVSDDGDRGDDQTHREDPNETILACGKEEFAIGGEAAAKSPSFELDRKVLLFEESRIRPSAVAKQLAT